MKVHHQFCDWAVRLYVEYLSPFTGGPRRQRDGNFRKSPWPAAYEVHAPSHSTHFKNNVCILTVHLTLLVPEIQAGLTFSCCWSSLLRRVNTALLSLFLRMAIWISLFCLHQTTRRSTRTHKIIYTTQNSGQSQLIHQQYLFVLSYWGSNQCL